VTGPVRRDPPGDVDVARWVEDIIHARGVGAGYGVTVTDVTDPGASSRDLEVAFTRDGVHAVAAFRIAIRAAR